MSESCEVVELDVRHRCRFCGLRALCLPDSIQGADLELIESLVEEMRLLAAGQAIVREGDPLRCLYLVRSGALKSVALSEDGRQQVLGFHLPGELVGVDATCCRTHRCEVRALVRSRVCVLPYERLQKAMRDSAKLQSQVMRLIGRETVLDHEHLMAMGAREAHARVAMALRSLSERRRRARQDADDLQLPMSREELANFLGLAEETVSRSFTRLQREGLLEVRGKRVRILDHHALAELCSSGEEPGRRAG